MKSHVSRCVYLQHDEALGADVTAPVRWFMHQHVALDVVGMHCFVATIRTHVLLVVALTTRNENRTAFHHCFLEV